MYEILNHQTKTISFLLLFKKKISNNFSAFKKIMNYLFSLVTGIALPPGRNSCVINFPIKSSSTENVSDKSETSPAQRKMVWSIKTLVLFQPYASGFTIIALDISQATV